MENYGSLIHFICWISLRRPFINKISCTNISNPIIFSQLESITYPLVSLMITINPKSFTKLYNSGKY